MAAETYYVIPDASTPCPDENYECHTLSEYAAELPRNSSNITLMFLEGMHNLSRDFSLTNISSITLENVDENEVTIFCSNDGSFVFQIIETVLIKNVSMADCYGNNITSANYVAITDTIVQGVSKISSEAVFHLIDIQDLNVVGCTFAFSTAVDLPSLSGAVLDVVSSNIAIYNSTFDQNSAESSGNIGCVLCSHDSSIVIMDSTFSNNTAVNSGSILSTMLILKSDVTIQNSSFIGNQAKTGGVLYGENSAITATGTTFAKNHATSFGGVMYLDESNFTLDFCTFSENSCGTDGGVIYGFRNSSVQASHTLFLHNVALGNAGVLLFSGSHAHASFSNCSFIRNMAENSGVVSTFGQATLHIDNSFFANNNATSLAIGAGGILNAQDRVTVTISSSTFIHNSAGTGGCALINNASSLSINSSIFENNTAKYGGAFTIVNSKLHIEGCDDWVRFVGNSAQHGGALNIIENSVAHVECTLFEHNKADVECFGTILSRSYNISCRGGAVLVRTDTNIYLVDTIFRENLVNGKGGAVWLHRE